MSLLESEAESAAVFRKRMESAEAKRIYKQRGPIAEFPNAWIKERIGLRKFRLRGLVKAGTEALWGCLTYLRDAVEATLLAGGARAASRRGVSTRCGGYPRRNRP